MPKSHFQKRRQKQLLFQQMKSQTKNSNKDVKMKSAIDFEDSLGMHTHVRKQMVCVSHKKNYVKCKNHQRKKCGGG